MVVKKFETRGGARTKKRTNYGPTILLDALWNKFGGVSATAKKLKIPLQNLINWRNFGKVTLTKVRLVADGLGIYDLGLNYEQFSQLSKNPPDWETVVKKYDLPPETIKKILSARAPKSNA